MKEKKNKDESSEVRFKKQRNMMSLTCTHKETAIFISEYSVGQTQVKSI